MTETIVSPLRMVAEWIRQTATTAPLIANGAVHNSGTRLPRRAADAVEDRFPFVLISQIAGPVASENPEQSALIQFTIIGEGDSVSDRVATEDVALAIVKDLRAATDSGGYASATGRIARAVVLNTRGPTVTADGRSAWTVDANLVTIPTT